MFSLNLILIKFCNSATCSAVGAGHKAFGHPALRSQAESWVGSGVAGTQTSTPGDAGAMGQRLVHCATTPASAFSVLTKILLLYLEKADR